MKTMSKDLKNFKKYWSTIFSLILISVDKY
jgi:hypothetical protein